MGRHEELEAEVGTRLEEILELAVKSHSTGGLEPETFQECLLCESWEDHKPGCIVPAIEAWLKCES